MTEADHNAKEIAVKAAGDVTEDNSNPVAVSVSVSMEVLNTSLIGVYNKKEKSSPETKEGQDITEFLVMPTDSPKGGMTIKQLVNEVNKMIADFSDSSEKLDEAQVQEKLNLVSEGGVLDKIRVELRQIFLYQQTIDTYDLNAQGKCDKTKAPKSTKKVLEYAINFIILSDITKNTAFRVDSISLGVWNTTRPSILNRMQMGNIQELLTD